MPNYKRYYLPNRYVFVTVVTHNRNDILVNNIDLLRQCVKDTKEKFIFDVFAIVILPNHFHMILKPQKIEEFSVITGSIKRRFTKALDVDFKNNNLSISKIKRKEKGIWQRRFYEHIIRDKKDLYDHLDYIHYNPVKHGYVENVKDWAFSSFNKFVQLENYDINWGSLEEVKHIEKYDYD
ncbi:MAG: transposase [Candidatus Gastranaerophilaceae bacterium]